MKQNVTFRFLSLLLVVALLVGILPVPAVYAEEAVPGEELMEQNEAEETPEGEISYVVSGEVPDLREESVKHFRMEDGSFIAVDYGTPVHYLDTDETWEDIDNTLLPTASAQAQSFSAAATTQATVQASDTYTAVNGEDEKTFAANLQTGFLFSSQTGSSAVQMFLTGSGGSSVSGSADMDQAANTGSFFSEDEMILPEDALSSDLAEDEVDETLQMGDTAVESEVSPDVTPEDTSIQEAENAWEDASDLSREELVSEDAFAVEEEVIPYNRYSSAQISYPDMPEEDEPSFWQNIAHGVQNLFSLNSDTEDAPVDSLDNQIVPVHLRSLVLYEDVYPGVDFQYELYSYDVKETILVKEPLDSYRFSFRLALDDLVPQMQEDGSILLLNENEEAVYSIPAPFMTDDNGEYSEAVSYALSENDDGTWTLTVAADADWFAEESRAFPVRIDPTLIKETRYSAFNGWNCNEIDYTINQNQNLCCGYHPYHQQTEILFQITNVPTIPAGATLTRAQVAFYQDDYYSDYSGSKIIMYMHEILGPVDFSHKVEWASKPAIGPVLDYNESGSFEKSHYLYWDVTSAAKHGQNNLPTYGLAMTSNATASNHNRAWFTYTDRFYYIVSYRDTVGIEPYYTYQTVGAGNAGTGYISDYTGNLTIVKELTSYASTVNPFTLNLVYNTNLDNGNNADPTVTAANARNFNMDLGSGFMLSVMQKVEKVQIKNDAVSGGTTTYLRYTDGDGTRHYFAKDSSRERDYYYDEDGLNLKISEYYSDYFLMEDDQGNKMYFVHGFLTIIQDKNGNTINIKYTHSDGTAESNGYPRTSGDRISSIVQNNNGYASITVAAFQYEGNRLTGITDAANRLYTLAYSSAGYLGRIDLTVPGANAGSSATTVLARYPRSGDKIIGMYDAEAQYGIGFTYSGTRVSSYYETISSPPNTHDGIDVQISQNDKGQTCYRDPGADRSSNTDDILTYYSFDYAGRTVNAYTTDYLDNLLGASNSVYSGVGTTDKKNNRTLRTATIGIAAMNVLRDSSFEQNSSDWTYTGANTGTTNILSKAENPRTGTRALKGWISNGINTTISATRATNTLYPGYDYTFSGYINTTGCGSFNGSGIYLQVSNSSGTALATSDYINYKTRSEIDGGWARLSVTFRVPSQGTYTVGVYNNGADGEFYADDLQVERGSAPSNRNLLQNGDLQLWNDAWTMGSGAHLENQVGLFAEGAYHYSIRLNGDPYVDSTAYQDVPINKAEETFVLSGWAKANAVPDNLTKATGDDAAEKDNHKQFGLRAIITYLDNTTEYHYAPFNPDLTDWQYTSLAIVPKKTQNITKIRVVCTYERNANKAYFDNLSLVRETAQTMKYDNDGNLVSVKSTGKSEETSTYSGGNLTSVKTGGNGTFTYTYDDKHNVTGAGNGVVKESFTVDARGNTTASSLTKKDGSGDKITSGAEYSSIYSGNLLTKSTDARGYNTTYSFFSTDGFNKMTGQPFSVTDPGGTVRKNIYGGPLGRISSNYIDSTVSLAYNYNSKGYLTSITRGGWDSTIATENRNASNKQSQTYSMDYDDLGNMTSMSVGSRNLVTNSYNSNTGALTGQTYGNGATVSFQYDDLGRKKQTTYSGGRTIDYTYTGDGQLYSALDTVGSNSVLYTYNYDSLGRLIGSKQSGSNIRTQYTYDTNNRLTRWDYAAPGLSTVYESYTYNSSSTDSISDGALTEMRMLTGDSIAFTYDTLSRLYTRQIARGIKETFLYTPGAEASTTTPLVWTKNLKVNGENTANLKYTYDENGNISKAENGTNSTSVDYTYDAQGQLLSAVHKSGGTITRTETYSYDTYGNIRSFSNGTSTHSYTYGDANWKDLLTQVDNHNLTYDEIGNPLTYYNGTAYSMSWSEGRRLSSLTTGGNTTTYTYDLNGLRNKKVNADGTWVEYFIADGKTIGETLHRANNTEVYDMRYTFDENGDVCGISIWRSNVTGWEKYYFLKSLQGDVLAIYKASDTFTKVGEYTYDSWGNVLSVTGVPSNDNAAVLNPFRYRSYYHDSETGFYYLQSRYYDPAIGRWISPEENLYSGGIDSGAGFIGYNAYAYCSNNPVIAADKNGEWLNIVIGAVVGGVVGGVSSIIKHNKDNPGVPIDWRSVAIAAAVGAAGGAVAATGLCMAAQAGITAAVSGVGDIATQMICEQKEVEDVDWKKAGWNAAVAGGCSLVGSVLGGITSYKQSITGDSMINSGITKITKAISNKNMGKSYSALASKGIKMVQQGAKLVNTGRGISSVTGSLSTWGLSMRFAK